MFLHLLSFCSSMLDTLSSSVKLNKPCVFFGGFHFCVALDQTASHGGPSSDVTPKTVCGAVRHPINQSWYGRQRDVKERSSLCVFL